MTAEFDLRYPPHVLYALAWVVFGYALISGRFWLLPVWLVAREASYAWAWRYVRRARRSDPVIPAPAQMPKREPWAGYR